MTNDISGIDYIGFNHRALPYADKCRPVGTFLNHTNSSPKGATSKSDGCNPSKNAFGKRRLSSTIIKIITIVLFTQLCNKTMAQQLPLIKISPNKHYFITEDKTPFFWLGDTGWLLFIKLNREEVIKYLDDRKAKGFNVIQVMVLHDTKHAVNRYGDSALVNGNPSMPKIKPGADFKDKNQYDFWDNVDFVIDEAAKRGVLYGLSANLGKQRKSGFVNEKQATDFATFLAKRYKNKSNIVWLNGGDILGSDKIEIWNALGDALRKNDPNHLITFHPRGRNQSSTWFHNASWLDFNMFPIWPSRLFAGHGKTTHGRGQLQIREYRLRAKTNQTNH